MGLGMLIALPAMLLVTLGVLAVAALPVVWLVRELGRVTERPLAPVAGAAGVCPNCHQGVESDWRNCAHCGQKVN